MSSSKNNTQSEQNNTENFWLSSYQFLKKIWSSICLFLQETWFLINQFLKETGREIITKKIIDNLLVYLIYLLIIASISYCGYQLSMDMYKHFAELQDPKKFPFILEFSEKLFLNFLPIFILFGLLNYYDLQWKRMINDSNKPNENSAQYLNFSKKLFFSSLLSYTTLKLIEKLFFEKISTENLIQFISIGAFFIVLAIFVLIQHNHSDKEHN